MRSDIYLDQTDIFQPLDVEKLGDVKFLGNKHSDILTIFHLSITFLVLIHLFYFIYMLIKQKLSKKKIPIQPTKPKNLRKINESCSICLEDITHEVQLICSHSYCGKCLIDYGKQRWNFVDIQCPMCRCESKLLFSQFERNEENKEIYDMVLKYSHETTSQHSTSFCLSLDILRFSLYYAREFKNISNFGFNTRKKLLIFAVLMIIFFVLYPLTFRITTYLELFEDLLTYVFLIVLCGEYLYRTFHSQTNTEYERTLVSINTNESQTQTDPVVISENAIISF